MDQTLLAIVGAIVVLLIGRRAYLGMRVKSYSAREASERLGQSKEVMLLDVRTSDERSRSRIDGSVHIPVNELSRRIGELERHRKREIICYCQTGSRSISAAAFLLKRGFVAANMKGGIAEWNFQHR